MVLEEVKEHQWMSQRCSFNVSKMLSWKAKSDVSFLYLSNVHRADGIQHGQDKHSNVGEDG